MNLRWAKLRLMTPGLLLLVGGVVFGSAVAQASFHYDDLHTIVDNETIRSMRHGVAWLTDPAAFTSLPFGGMYRPLVVASYGLTYAMAGLQPSLFVAGNLLIHILAAALVWRLLQRFLPAGERSQSGTVAAAVGALVFLLHPINVEVVTYVSSRSESLAALGVLAALLSWQRTQWVAAFCYAIGLLAKSVAIVTPLLLVCWDVLIERRPIDRRFLLRHAPIWGVSLVYLLMVRGAVSTAMGGDAVRPLIIQWLTQIKALIYYLRLLVMPRGLTVEHDFIEATSLSPVVLVAGVLLGTLGWLGLALWRRSDGQALTVLWWLVWPVVVLAPVLVVPLNVLVNEHRLYLSSIVVGVLAAVAVRRFGNRWWVGAWLVILAVLSMQRSQVWADSETLWQDAAVKAPSSPRVHLFVGDAHQRGGRADEALAAYDRALKVNPERLTGGDLLALHNNRGAMLLSKGLFPEARQAYAKALILSPTYAPAVEAMEALRAMATAGARDPEAQRLAHSGLQALVMGRYRLAETQLRASLSRQSDDAAMLALGLVHERQGQIEEAARVYERLAVGAQKPTFAATARSKFDSLMNHLQP